MGAGGIAAAAAVVAGARARALRSAERTLGGTEPEGNALPQLVAGARDRAAADGAPPERLTFGVADVYREARRAFGRAAREPDREALAELLERSTTLWYALTFTEAFAGRETKRLARDTRRLTDLLREHRDLDALAGVAHDGVPLSPEALVRFDAFGERRRRRLQRRILDAGRELFGTKPGRLAHRLADEQTELPSDQ